MRNPTDVASEFGPVTNFAAVTVVHTRPGPPVILDVDPRLEGTLGVADVWWDAPTPNGTPAVDSYEAFWVDTGDQQQANFTATASARNGRYEFPNVGGLFYEGLRMRAHNANGWGPWVEWHFAGTNVITFIARPPAPTSLSATVDQGSSPDLLSLSWVDPDAPSIGNTDVYEVRIDGPVDISRDVAGAQFELILQDLPAGFYEWKIRSRGTSTYSEWATRLVRGRHAVRHELLRRHLGPPVLTPTRLAGRSGIGRGYSDGTFEPASSVCVRRWRPSCTGRRRSPNGTDPRARGDPFLGRPGGPATPTAVRSSGWSTKGSRVATRTARSSPTAPVSRQAMASFLYKATDANRGPSGPNTPPVCGLPAGFAPAAGPPTFTDVPPGHTFCPSITWLAAEEISTGYEDGTFRPAVAVSRQAMASFLSRWTPWRESVLDRPGPVARPGCRTARADAIRQPEPRRRPRPALTDQRYPVNTGLGAVALIVARPDACSELGDGEGRRRGTDRATEPFGRLGGGERPDLHLGEAPTGPHDRGMQAVERLVRGERDEHVEALAEDAVGEVEQT